MKPLDGRRKFTAVSMKEKGDSPKGEATVIYLINSREINVLNQTSHDCILLFGKKMWSLFCFEKSLLLFQEL